MIFPRRVIIFAIAVTLVSGFFSFYVKDRPRVDAKAYDKIAWNLARGIGYVEEESLATTPAKDDAIVRVGPGYEFFLAGIYNIVGHRYSVVWALQAVLRGLSVLLVYAIAQVLFVSASTSFLAALLFGLSPDLIVVNGFLLTETLFIFFVLAGVYTSLYYFLKPTGFRIFSTGLLWALAVLVRPVAILSLLVVFGILVWKRSWKDILIFLIAPVLIVGSWSAYATHRYGSFILTTTAGGYDLWVGNNINATGGFEKTPEIQELRNKTHSVELEKISRKKYFEFLFGHPLKFIELQFRKFAIYFDVLRPGGVWIGLYAHYWLLLAIVAASLFGNMVFFGAGLAGLWVMIKKRSDVIHRVFVAMAFVAPLGAIPIIVETRYRYPFFPFLAIGAAFFLTQRFFDMKVLGRIFILLSIFAVYDLWFNFEGLMERLQNIL